MLHAAQITLRELRAARLDVHELADGRRRPLRLASQCATNYQWMAHVLRSLHQQLPGTEVRVESLPDDDPIAALLDDRLDVALVTKLDHDVNRVRLEHLFDDELRAVVSSSHPWANRASVARRRLRRGASRALRQLRPGEDARRAVADPARRPPGSPHHRVRRPRHADRAGRNR